MMMMMIINNGRRCDRPRARRCSLAWPTPRARTPRCRGHLAERSEGTQVCSSMLRQAAVCSGTLRYMQRHAAVRYGMQRYAAVCYGICSGKQQRATACSGIQRQQCGAERYADGMRQSRVLSGTSCENLRASSSSQSATDAEDAPAQLRARRHNCITT